MSAGNPNTQDTICAIATPPGRGGIGIVRLSGPTAHPIGESLCGTKLKPRYAHFTPFKDSEQNLDEGIALFFPAPHSYTGEDVVELQGHGSPPIQQALIEACLARGARLAEPGEFSQRAFLNDRLDLTQAEAVADLINASTAQAARAAQLSLQGAFSRHVNHLQDQLTQLRVLVEATIDFPEEELDPTDKSNIQQRLKKLITQTDALLIEAHQAALYQEGARAVIIGRPNAGKSSLLNQLVGYERAIITDQAGTTRDTIEQTIDLDGLPLTLTDTAGLNERPDKVEKIGIERSLASAKNADILLFVFDATQQKNPNLHPELGDYTAILDTNKPILYLANKCDLLAGSRPQYPHPVLWISATQGVGIETLKKAIKTCLYNHEGEPRFSARTRHVEALQRAATPLQHGLEQFTQNSALELLAEDLRHSQLELGGITGTVSADELLGEIFSHFCIGK